MTMTGYKRIPLDGWARTVYWNGRMWTRARSPSGFWFGKTGWTTVQYNRDIFGGMMMLNVNREKE